MTEPAKTFPNLLEGLLAEIEDQLISGVKTVLSAWCNDSHPTAKDLDVIVMLSDAPDGGFQPTMVSEPPQGSERFALMTEIAKKKNVIAFVMLYLGNITDKMSSIEKTYPALFVIQCVKGGVLKWAAYNLSVGKTTFKLLDNFTFNGDPATVQAFNTIFHDPTRN